jgi:hypothetical protein
MEFLGWGLLALAAAIAFGIAVGTAIDRMNRGPVDNEFKKIIRRLDDDGPH